MSASFARETESDDAAVGSATAPRTAGSLCAQNEHGSGGSCPAEIRSARPSHATVSRKQRKYFRLGTVRATRCAHEYTPRSGMLKQTRAPAVYAYRDAGAENGRPRHPSSFITVYGGRGISRGMKRGRPLFRGRSRGDGQRRPRPRGRVAFGRPR